MFDTYSVTATEIKAHCPNARYAQFYFEDSGCGGEELNAVYTVLYSYVHVRRCHA
jgi:hypothetical protein